MSDVHVEAILGQIQSHLLSARSFQTVDTTELFDAVAAYNKLVTSPETLSLSWTRPSARLTSTRV
ncbi:hypothetical protein [Bifidobacterium favimelis]|uniref:Uncharacterized protein n=1 Tax=Bifidobacterium favimelis TaxID=3122979 RepID=A0ABU8ZPY7_9BIFI